MKLKSNTALLALSLPIQLLALASPALAAPMATSPSVVFVAPTGASELALLVLPPTTPSWVDVPGLTTTLNLSKAAPVVVSYNLTVQSGITSETCHALMRVMIGDTAYIQTVVHVASGTTTSGGQTVGMPTVSGTVAVKIQALQTTNCDLRVLTVPWGAGTDVWGSSMTVMVLR